MPRFQVNKGSASVAFLGMVVFLVALSVVLVSGVGYSPSDYSSDQLGYGQSGKDQIIVPPPSPTGHDNLQLRTFGIVTIPPSPTPAAAHGCQNAQFNDEPEILVGSDPAPNGTVGPGGQIRVWVSDEGAPHIAPGEQIDPTTGQILVPGDRTANDGAGSNYYLWEPSIYITNLQGIPATGPFPGDAENGGKAYFPVIMKGSVNPSSRRGAGIQGPPIDDFHAFENGPNYAGKPIKQTLSEKYQAEYIWDVNSFGLTSGNYRAQFVIHDGDDNMGIDCFTITIP